MPTHKKTILIFGAGLNQLELINAARELNITSVVIDPMSDPIGKKASDFFFQIACNDYATTKGIAQKHKVDGIVTAQMENPLRLMAQLANEMGYVFHTPQVIEKCTNKYLMKQAFLKHDVPCANGILLSKNAKLNLELLQKQNLTFPLIIKPLDAHSSRGVYKSDNFEELSVYAKESTGFSSTGELIIEEFLEGKEYSIEAITYKGETHIIQFTEKIITPYPRTVEIGHMQPATLNAKELRELESVTKNAIFALGIDNSASHTELKITPNGVKVIEVGARLGGDFIGSYLTMASTGVNMDKAAIQVALGIEPNLTPTKKSYSFIKYIELPVGMKVQEVSPIDILYESLNVVFAHIYVKAGDTIHSIEHSAHRPACVIVDAKTIIDAKTKAKKAECFIKENLIKLS